MEESSGRRFFQLLLDRSREALEDGVVRSVQEDREQDLSSLQEWTSLKLMTAATTIGALAAKVVEGKRWLSSNVTVGRVGLFAIVFGTVMAAAGGKRLRKNSSNHSLPVTTSSLQSALRSRVGLGSIVGVVAGTFLLLRGLPTLKKVLA